MKKDQIDTLASVREFHESYGLPVAHSANIDDERVNGLRIELIREELEELTEALKTRDLTEVLDALTDLQYVLDGAYLSFGLHGLKETAFSEVHRSNMSKACTSEEEALQPLPAFSNPNFFGKNGLHVNNNP